MGLNIGLQTSLIHLKTSVGHLKAFDSVRLGQHGRLREPFGREPFGVGRRIFGLGQLGQHGRLLRGRFGLGHYVAQVADPS